MNITPQSSENQASAAQTGGEKAVLDLHAPEALHLPDAANTNEEPLEDPAEVYFAHG